MRRLLVPTPAEQTVARREAEAARRQEQERASRAEAELAAALAEVDRLRAARSERETPSDDYASS